MRILSANVNGLRSALDHGFFDLEHVAEADVICLQETRCEDAAAIGTELGFHAVALDRGRHDETGKTQHGGVAIFSRRPLKPAENKPDDALVAHGQFISCTIDGIAIASVYVTLKPEPAQLEALRRHFAELRARERGALICGDMNTFRDERDSWSFAANKERGGYGCDPAAMEWFAETFRDGWMDAIGADNATKPLYTWWSRNDLFERGDGTRLDYILVSPVLAPSLRRGSTLVSTRKRFGGHAQVALTLDADVPAAV